MSTLKTNSDNNVVYFQSGGPTAVINATFKGLFDAYLKDKNRGTFYVSRFGLTGLLENRLVEVNKDELPKLEYRPGSYWGSLRRKLPLDSSDPIAKTLMANIKKNHIGYIFVNGGNDSMNTAYRISQYAKDYQMDVKVIGIPKTIDNDLYGCDHTPGFGTAAKFVANAVIATSIDDKTYQKGRVNIIETMGRDSGFVAASAILASLKGEKPDYIFVPEVPFSVDSFLEKVKATYEKKGRCLVVVSEGIRDKDGVLIASDSATKDAFNNAAVGGVGKYLSALVDKAGMKTRGIELSVLNRASGFLPSLVDVKEAEEVSAKAYEFALKGYTGVMVALGRKHSQRYAPNYTKINLEEVSDKVVTLPKKYINKAMDNITPSYIDYVAPLIKGNDIALGKDGLMDL
jgi:ATP-dependent phosphofructokinase / diphosphate-dependent phosphofructokinase